MRETKPALTPELEEHRRGAPIWKAPAYEVTNFRGLVEHVARLAYANADELLFFRGQDKDYQSKAGEPPYTPPSIGATHLLLASCVTVSIFSIRRLGFLWSDSRPPRSMGIASCGKSGTSKFKDFGTFGR